MKPTWIYKETFCYETCNFIALCQDTDIVSFPSTVTMDVSDYV